MSVLTNSIDASESHISDPPLTSCVVQSSSSPSLLSSLTLPSIVGRVEYEYLQIPQIEQNCQTIGEVFITPQKYFAGITSYFIHVCSGTRRALLICTRGSSLVIDKLPLVVRCEEGSGDIDSSTRVSDCTIL